MVRLEGKDLSVHAPSFPGEPPLPTPQIDLLAADTHENADREDTEAQQ